MSRLHFTKALTCHWLLLLEFVLTVSLRKKKSGKLNEASLKGGFGGVSI